MAASCRKVLAGRAGRGSRCSFLDEDRRKSTGWRPPVNVGQQCWTVALINLQDQPHKVEEALSFDTEVQLFVDCLGQT